MEHIPAGIEVAIKRLRPNVEHWDHYAQNGKQGFLRWDDPTGSEPPTWSEISLECRKLHAIWDYYEYARDREKLYKDFGDQLDMLYNDIKNGNLENGEWVKHVESVKAQIPKPIDEPPDVESWTMDKWGD